MRPKSIEAGKAHRNYGFPSEREVVDWVINRSGGGMVDTRVLEALAVRREGSSPFPSTILLGITRKGNGKGTGRPQKWPQRAF